MSSIRDRMKLFLKEIKISEGVFEESVGLSKGYVSNIGDTIRNTSLSKIKSKYKNLNTTWLITGEGEMLITNTSKSPKLEAIPLRLADPDGYESTPDKFYELADGSLIMQVPIIPLKAYAGYLRGFGDPEFYEDLPTIPLPVEKRHSGAYLGFEVSGDSMVCLDSEELAERSIWPGRIAIGRELSRHQWQYKLHTHNYDTWVIVHKTEGILIKEIVKHDVENCVITVHSLNTKYKDQELHLNDVEQIFSVVQIIKKAR